MKESSDYRDGFVEALAIIEKYVVISDIAPLDKKYLYESIRYERDKISSPSTKNND